MATSLGKGIKRGWLTPPGLASLKPGEWASDAAPRGQGRMLARRLKNGRVALYFRYVTANGRRDTLPIGMFDARGRDGLTLHEARAKVGELRQLRNEDGDIRATWEAIEREKDRARKAEQAARDAEADKRSRTLGSLLTAYVDQMERDGKTSARSVRGELDHHVRDKRPELWAAPLTDLTPDDLLAIVAAPADAGNLRQAEKVRAYLRAAFSAGMKARHNAKALPTLRALRVTENPARDLTPIEGANRERERALSIAELRSYWQRIQTPELAVLRFHLLTGCQRIKQLARVTQADLDDDTRTIRLLDYKGRRSNPRKHDVPLIPAALDALHEMNAGAVGPYLFTLTAGISGADYSGIYKRVRAIAAKMESEGDLPGGSFTPGDLRRTVETVLSGRHVPKETRAHLQSHGLGGVQDRHYDKHAYLAEKRGALKALHRLLAKEEAEEEQA